MIPLPYHNLDGNGDDDDGDDGDGGDIDDGGDDHTCNPVVLVSRARCEEQIKLGVSSAFQNSILVGTTAS